VTLTKRQHCRPCPIARRIIAAGTIIWMASSILAAPSGAAEEMASEPLAQAGTPREAAAFGDVVLVSVPYAVMPQIGRDYAAELAGKIVLDTQQSGCGPRR